jgi:hypothetical protein
MRMCRTSFDYAFLPVIQTRGDIIVAWCPNIWSLSGISNCTYSLSATVLQLAIGAVWVLTTVYDRQEKRRRMTSYLSCAS